MRPAPGRRRWLVPEVVQTSAMDCGPASLKALLEGFGVSVSYGRLREACQTDVDGTSIDTLEDIACQLGLAAEQIIVPRDHLFRLEARYLPAIIVVRHPAGHTHFVVAWSRVGPWIQVMDPGVGRRWMRVERLARDLYQHGMTLPAADWRDYATTPRFQNPLRGRLADLGVSAAEVDRLVEAALADPGVFGLAALDAAARTLTALVEAGGLRRGAEATGMLGALLERLRADPSGALELVPRLMWSAAPHEPDEQGEAQIFALGAVAVRVVGVRALLPSGRDPLDVSSQDLEEPPGEEGAPALDEVTPLPQQAPAPPALPPALAAALSEAPASPGATLLEQLRADGLLAPGILSGALFLAVGGVTVEALLYRGLFDVGSSLALPLQRVGAVGALLLFGLGMLLVEWTLQVVSLRMGRVLELRLRVAFQQKIPRLGDRYLQSRLTSDMAERGHSSHGIRGVPALGVGFLRSSLGLLATTLGIAWLDPVLAPLAALAALVSVGLPLLVQPMLTERDLRFRTHLGALSRYYLDALLGLTAVRTHGAEPGVRRQHEALLTTWTTAGLELQSVAVGLEGLSAFTGFLIAGGLLAAHLAHVSGGAGMLLLAWWALALPALGQSVAQSARQYPGLRNLTLRLLEPLGAPDETDGLTSRPTESDAREGGVALDFQDVAVRAAGHTILEGIDVRVAPGEEIAVVGASGAGKSSFLGLLLGWHRAAEGRVLVDGEPLEGEVLARLRRQTAWVDPSVQLWNRSFLENLLYGAEAADMGGIAEAMRTADLRDVLERLPDGLSTPLGEGGALLSGGQGQRVRLGRAALRRGARLVLLDEPFRGLDRDRRRDLLERARARWAEATFVVVTHDVGDTMHLPRVLVVEAGRVVEDGPPAALAADPGSRYRALLDAEREVREGLWGGEGWRRWSMVNGHLREQRSDRAP